MRMPVAKCVAGDWILGGMAHIEFARRNSAGNCSEIGQIAVRGMDHLATSVLPW